VLFYDLNSFKSRKTELDNESQDINSKVLRDQEKVIIYFHGNSEDVSQLLTNYYSLRENFNVSVVACEYPGYGFFKHSIRSGKRSQNKITTSTRLINEVVDMVYAYTVCPQDHGGLGFKQENVTVVGRSIGTGPACRVASLNSPGGLVLISPFTNFVQLALSKRIPSYFAKKIGPQFDNLQAM